jgi:putative oxidoreductase
MERWLGRHSDVTYALMRFIVGALFACHGAQKLFGVLGGQVMTGVPMMLAAGLIEFGCGVLVAVGLEAGFAAFLASGQMACAYFMVHASGGFWPIVNKGELAALYCLVFLYIASHGSGAYSIDRAIRGKRRR